MIYYITVFMKAIMWKLQALPRNTCPETLAAELLVHQVPFVTFDVAYQHGCPTGRDNGGLEPCHAEAHDDIRRVPNEIVIT